MGALGRTDNKIWAADFSGILWNAVELAEKGQKLQLARMFKVSLLSNWKAVSRGRNTLESFLYVFLFTANIEKPKLAIISVLFGNFIC